MHTVYVNYLLKRDPVGQVLLPSWQPLKNAVDAHWCLAIKSSTWVCGTWVQFDPERGGIFDEIVNPALTALKYSRNPKPKTSKLENLIYIRKIAVW